MAITFTASANGGIYTLPNDLGTITFDVVDDAGTERIRIDYNSGKVADITPAGGHVEGRQPGTLPSGFEWSVA